MTSRTRIPSRRRRKPDDVTAWAEAVCAGDVPAGRWTVAACRRHLADLEKSRDRKYPWIFDPDRANRIILFTSLLPATKGQKANLFVQPWQKFVLGSLFGWVSRSDGARRYRTAYVQVARKNGKSTLAAAIALYCLAADGENGPEVYTAATTRDQARIVFDAALGMVRRCPAMAKALRLDAQKRGIFHGPSLGKLIPLSADARTLEGLDTHCAIIDELHVHPTREVWDVITSSTGARRQPLIFAISTAGTDLTGIGHEVYQYSLAILREFAYQPGDRLQNDRHVSIIFAIDDEDDWRDETTWAKANPSLGVTLSLDDLRDKAARAETLPAARANFLTKHLDLWLSSNSAWIDISQFDSCQDPALTLEDFQGLPCWIGVDLATRVDIASIAILARREDGKWLLTSRHFAPEAAAKNNPLYRQFSQHGHLTLTAGASTSLDRIEAEIRELCARLDVRMVALDPYQAAQLTQHLTASGIPAVEFRQTVANMSPAMRHLEALILDRQLVTDTNQTMRWMFSNVVCHVDAKDNVYPRRPSADRKIDGAVAAIMALGVAGGADSRRRGAKEDVIPGVILL